MVHACIPSTHITLEVNIKVVPNCPSNRPKAIIFNLEKIGTRKLGTVTVLLLLTSRDGTVPILITVGPIKRTPITAVQRSLIIKATALILPADVNVSAESVQ